MVASLLFYAYWRPINLLIIGGSLLVNFTIAHSLLKLADQEAKARLRAALLSIGVSFNILFLGYFKYINFIQMTLNDVAGTDFVLKKVVLPLGISFITFQKIAFLVDVHARRVESFSCRQFLLFVLFFPQLIAGPIVHFREMMPQFASNPCRFDRQSFAVGMTLFAFGLFKKVVLADGIAVYVTPVYELAAADGGVSLFPAWLAALGFTLQIYFDFSGYSDMAGGLARCFGVRLPVNFDSPLKASNIIDFWSRWHITLTRFLTAYVYNPIALGLTRRRLSKGLPGFGGRQPKWGAFFQVLALPTVVTMFLSGLWHGAGFMFILWGLIHGAYLAINHAWRIVGPRWPGRREYERFMDAGGWFVTFAAVVVAMVFFRAPTWSVVQEILLGMVGINGVAVPAVIVESLGLAGVLEPIAPGSVLASARDFVVAGVWVTLLLIIALLFPNSLEVLARHEPMLGVEAERAVRIGVIPLEWRPSLAWTVLVSCLAATAVLRLGGPSEFLYWQF